MVARPVHRDAATAAATSRHSARLARHRCRDCRRTFYAITGTALARHRHRARWLTFSAALRDAPGVRAGNCRTALGAPAPVLVARDCDRATSDAALADLCGNPLLADMRRLASAGSRGVVRSTLSRDAPGLAFDEQLHAYDQRHALRLDPRPGAAA